MVRRLTRSLVALSLVVAVPAAAWAACGASLAGAQAKPTCHARSAEGDGCCPMARGAGEVPDCCKVKTQTSQPGVLMTPAAPAAPDRAVAMGAAVEVSDAAAVPAAQLSLVRALGSPLKRPHEPTYLRNSVLLI